MYLGRLGGQCRWPVQVANALDVGLTVLAPWRGPGGKTISVAEPSLQIATHTPMLRSL
jgi:hypothetical protein